QCVAGQCRRGSVPHSASLGPRAAGLLPARWQSNQRVLCDRLSSQQWLGGDPGGYELLLAQQLPAAGRFELPALAVDSGGGHGGVPFPPPSRRTRSCQGTNMMLERASLRLAMRVAILAPLVAVCSGRAPGPDEANSVQ